MRCALLDLRMDGSYTDSTSEVVMANTVAQMSKKELTEVIERSIERKLLELLGDPDQGLAIRKSVTERLLRQKNKVARGDRGERLDDVLMRLGME